MTMLSDRKLNIVMFSIIFGFLAFTMYSWVNLPIFPDEIAYRLMNGRAITDSGIARKVYYLCDFSEKKIPYIFFIPAYVISYFDLSLSSYQMRYFPRVVFFILYLMIFIYAAKKSKTEIVSYLAIGFIGVSGSGLLIGRPEYFLTMNIGAVILSFIAIDLGWATGLISLLLMGCVFITLLFSLFAHMQGLLFLPISAIVSYYLLEEKYHNRISVLIIGLCSFFLTISTYLFNKMDCSHYPEINSHLSEKLANLTHLKNLGLMGYLYDSFNRYLYAFTFNMNYHLNYLPGFKTETLEAGGVIEIINNLLRFLLLFNFATFIGIFLIILAIKVASIRLFKPNKSFHTSLSNSNLCFLLSFMFVAPVLILFVYDFEKSFYRPHFINLLISLFNVIFIISIKDCVFDRYIKLAGFIVLGVALITTAINWSTFSKEFETGYVGPSVSVFVNKDEEMHNVESIIADLNIPAVSGHILIDDYTYDYLKKFPDLFSLTYLHENKNLTGYSEKQVMELVGVQSIISRCEPMRAFGISPMSIHGKFCGYIF